MKERMYKRFQNIVAYSLSHFTNNSNALVVNKCCGLLCSNFFTPIEDENKDVIERCFSLSAKICSSIEDYY